MADSEIPAMNYCKETCEWNAVADDGTLHIAVPLAVDEARLKHAPEHLRYDLALLAKRHCVFSLKLTRMGHQ